MAIIAGTTRQAVSDAFGTGAAVRSDPRSPILIQSRQTSQAPTPSRTETRSVARRLADYWLYEADAAFRNAWNTEFPPQLYRRKDFELTAFESYLLFSVYHWADLYHRLSRQWWLPGPQDTPSGSFSHANFADDGVTWNIWCDDWPDVPASERFMVYIYQVNPLHVGRDSRNTATRFLERAKASSLTIPISSLSLSLHWPWKPGQPCQIFWRLRQSAEYGPNQNLTATP